MPAKQPKNAKKTHLVEHQFKPGNPGGPGRPLGQRNFATLYREALVKLAQANQIDPDSLEVDLVTKAIAEARKGHLKYYQDLMDRLHGKAAQPIVGPEGGPVMEKGDVDVAELARRMAEELKKKKT